MDSPDPSRATSGPSPASHTCERAALLQPGSGSTAQDWSTVVPYNHVILQRALPNLSGTTPCFPQRKPARVQGPSAC